jgi:peptide/nickel transport system substrate-binding protein
MDNRFGFKDFVYSLLLVALLVSVWLAMKQYDRQWQTMQDSRRQMTELSQALTQLGKDVQAMARPAGDSELRAAVEAQGRTLAEIRDLLAQGVSIESSGATNTQTTAASPDATTTDPSEAAGADDPFYRWRAAMAQPDYARGDWIVDAFGQTTAKLTPLISLDVYGSRIQSYVLESLITRDPETLEWKPWIARDWQVSPDGLTISFDLREGVKFADGQPLTSADVVYTFELIMNPDINCPRLRPYYEVVASVKAEGPLRVVFELREPYFLAMSIAGGMEILAKHYYSQFTAEQFNEMPGLLFGSGPYKLDVDPRDWQPGKGRIVLVRNENYWGPKPAFDRVVYREITDETARQVSFRNGETDRYGIPADQYERLRHDEDFNKRGRLLEYETIAGGYRYVGWNQKKKDKPTFFADVRVRRAMTMLLDRQAMCQQLQQGLATPTSGPFHRLSDQADPTVQGWPYDVEAAKALLAEAGFADRDGNGVIEAADGTPFRFKLTYPASSNDYKQMVLFMRDAYAHAGIVLEPDPLEWTIMLQRMDERNFDAITLGWGGTIESDPKQIFHSASIAEGGDNYVNYANPQLDKLIDTARVTMDESKRRALWHQVHRILHEDEPYTFLFTRKAVIFVDKRFGNVQVTKTGLNEYMEWYTPKPLQRWSQ